MIARFLEKCGRNGLNDVLVGFDDKTAYAQTIVAYCIGPGEKVHLFEGRTDGVIVRSRGSTEFGWVSIYNSISYLDKCAVYSFNKFIGSYI